MIRSSEFGSRQPTREVTAQRYQAAVTPAAPPVSGVEKLLDFGSKALQTKFQWDKDAFQADMTLANDAAEAKIKAMKPEDYAKDPDAAWEAAGGNKMYELLDTAPPGTQKVMRKQLDTMKSQTANAMQATFAMQEHARAVVVNTESYLKKNGTLTPEMFNNIHKMDEKNQTVAYSAAAQTARTAKSLQFFDDALANPDTPANERDMLTRVRRETEGDIRAEARFKQSEARRQQREAKAQQKEMTEAGDLNSAVYRVSVLQEHPERVAMETSVPVSKLLKVLRKDPKAWQAMLATGYVPSGMVSSMKDGFKNLSTPDKKIPQSYTDAANDELNLIQTRQGNVNGLNGVVHDDASTIVASMAYDAYLQEQDKTDPRTRRSYAEIRNSIDRTVPLSANAKPDDGTQRAEIKSATDALNISQKSQFDNIYGGVRMRSGSHEKALEIALNTVQEGTQTTGGGYVINDVHVLKNRLTQRFGRDVNDEEGLDTIINKGVDSAIITYAKELTKVTGKDVSADPEMWKQVGSANGALYFQYLGYPPQAPLIIGEKAFNTSADHLKSTNDAIGTTRATYRGESPESFDWSSGYPIQKMGGQ